MVGHKVPEKGSLSVHCMSGELRWFDVGQVMFLCLKTKGSRRVLH